MKQNQLYAVIAALVVVVIGLGVYIWREQTKSQGVEIRLDQNGLSVEKN
jgi:hypothetical protein